MVVNKIAAASSRFRNDNIKFIFYILSYFIFYYVTYYYLVFLVLVHLNVLKPFRTRIKLYLSSFMYVTLSETSACQAAGLPVYRPYSRSLESTFS